MAERLFLTVVIPTRNRPDQVVKSVMSILAGRYRNFEIIVVDQSDNDLTTTAVGPLLNEDTRVRLVSDQPLGSSHARNVGIVASEGEVIAFTDDDCEAEDAWLDQVAAEFAADPEVGAACGAVIPAAFDASAGFIVGFEPRRRARRVGRLAKIHDAGIGANMSFRRTALEEVGGWDELLGAGGFFDGAGDRDLIYRVLGGGWSLLQLPDARVVHNGFRDWQAGRALMRGRFRGVGAAFGKHLRLGDPIALLVLLNEFWQAIVAVGRSILTARRPLGVGRLIGLSRGVLGSFSKPIDPKTKRYASRAGRETNSGRRLPPTGNHAAVVRQHRG